MKRPILIAVIVIDLFVVVGLFYSDIKDFIWAHPWWQSALAASPEIALAVFAWIESRHSGEANKLRAEANDLRAEANRLRARNAELTSELDTERNKHLQQIADNTRKPVTRAQRNADLLRKHLRATVTVTEGQGNWGGITPEIVEVKDDVVTLFLPRSAFSSQAGCVRVHCDDLEISDIRRGSFPLQLKILKRYGPDVWLGEITRWEDRDRPAATPTFAKGDVAYHAEFVKPGSPERRTLAIFKSKDGTNSFLLEASTGEKPIGDNVEISKRFMMMFVEYEAAGFRRGNAGIGVSPYPLYIHSN
jgi:hypothetical protein